MSQKIGEILLSKGYITIEQLNECIEIQNKLRKEKYQNGNMQIEIKKIGDILIEKGYISEEELINVLSEQTGYPIFEKEVLTNDDFDLNVVKLLKDSIAKEIEVILLKKSLNKIQAITTDPTDFKIKMKLKSIPSIDVNKIDFYIVTKTFFNNIFNQLYKINLSINEFMKEEKDKKSNEDIYFEEDENSINTILEIIIQNALNKRATDIHIEPTDDDVVIRYRIDTIPIIDQRLPKVIEKRIITKLKTESGVKTDQRFVPQDGRFSRTIGEKTYDFRINFLPILMSNGDVSNKMAIRILDKSKLNADITEIGFTNRTFEEYKQIISEPSGLVLVVGPMGSGKTTTLYSTIRYLNPVKKIITTLEDPPEFIIPYVNQCRINNEQDFTYASGLKAILRQDTDVILVGEIRDSEVAHLSVQAAEIGRLVLSTLHVDNAVATITRLVNLGISPYFISTVLNGVVSQRLMRRICPYCVDVYRPHEKDIENMSLFLGKDLSNHEFKKGIGCSKCNNTGYLGLVAVHEILNFKKMFSLKDYINKDLSLDKMMRLAYEDGFKPISYDGYEKVLAGLTTVEEVNRVILDLNQLHYMKIHNK